MVFLPRHDKIFGVPARVDGTPKGDGARHETRWKRKAYRKFCEYMRHHSARVPKSRGQFRAGLFATLGSLISTIPLARRRLTLASGSLSPQFSSTYFNGIVPPDITAELTQILSNLVLGDNEIRSKLVSSFSLQRQIN